MEELLKDIVNHKAFANTLLIFYSIPITAFIAVSTQQTLSQINEFIQKKGY